MAVRQGGECSIEPGYRGARGHLDDRTFLGDLKHMLNGAAGCRKKTGRKRGRVMN